MQDRTLTPLSPVLRKIWVKFQTLLVQILPLSDAECKECSEKWLQLYGKQLDTAQINTILTTSTATRNPLYLTTFLNELRSFGIYELLNSRIGFYLTAPSISGMCHKVLERLELDFEQHFPDLVRYMLCLLLLAHDGISENELKGCLGLAMGLTAAKKNFPSIEFSSILLRLNTSLTNSQGLLTIGIPALQQAIFERYLLPEAVDRKAMFKFDATNVPITAKMYPLCQLLVTFFIRRPVNNRKVAELPWHLFQILQYHTKLAQSAAAEANVEDAKAELVDTLCDIRLIPLFCSPQHIYRLHSYWQFLEQDTHLSMSLAFLRYKAALDREYQAIANTETPTAELSAIVQTSEHYSAIGTFLMNTSRFNGTHELFDRAISLFERCLVHPANSDEYQKKRYRSKLETALSKKASLVLRLGRLDEAALIIERCKGMLQEDLTSTQEPALKKKIRGEIALLSLSLADVTKQMPGQNQQEKAVQLYLGCIEELILCQGATSYAVATARNQLADLYLRLDQPERAIRLFQQALEALKVNLGTQHADIASTMSSYASCFVQLQDLDKALSLYEESLQIRVDLLGVTHVSCATVYNNLARLHLKRHALPEAQSMFTRLLAITDLPPAQFTPALQGLASVQVELKQYPQAAATLEKCLFSLKATAKELKMATATTTTTTTTTTTEGKSPSSSPRSTAARETMLLVVVSLVNLYSSKLKKNSKITAHAEFGLELVAQLKSSGSSSDQSNSVAIAQSQVKLLTALGTSYQRQEDFDVAITYFSEAVDVLRNASAVDEKALATALVNSGFAYSFGDHSEEAKAVFTEALAIRQLLYEESSMEVLEVLECLSNFDEDDEEEDSEDEEDEEEADDEEEEME
jgi:tetratricopeptide (TPR) repeat protein